jgi:hypothetical protein
MGQLYGLFKNVPPVVRRRAKELLDIILDAVRKYDNAGAKNSLTAPLMKSNEKSADALVSEGYLTAALGSHTNCKILF